MWVSPAKNWRERGFRKPGRKPDATKAVLKSHFGLTESQTRRASFEQLVNCKDAAAVRLLLGKSR